MDNFMDELSKLMPYKDKAGGYNKLMPVMEIEEDDDKEDKFNIKTAFRDKHRVVFKDPDGFMIDRNEQGYVIPYELNEILVRAYNSGASDIHISVGTCPKARVHGELLQMPYEVITPLIARDILQSVLNDNMIDVFEKEGDIDLAYSIPGVCRFRVNLYKQRGTWAGVFRTLSNSIPSASKLGIPSSVMELTTRKRGLILVTGPTGSGKSTTLASMIDAINSRDRKNIITLEDPVEYLHKHKMCNINQREMGSDSKSFASAIRAALREDPDVILIGEMRDPETIATAVTAAETGHLVLSTLHTIGAAATIDRIVDSFPENQQSQVRTQLAMVLEGVVSQQLIPTADERGRTAAFEIMLGNVAIRNLIRENKTNMIASQMQMNVKDGMTLMDDSIVSLYKSGQITKDKAIEFAVDKAQMRNRI